MTQQQRISYWQELVEAQSRSGLDVTSFCRDQSPTILPLASTFSITDRMLDAKLSGVILWGSR